MRHSREQHCEPTSQASATAEQAATQWPSKQLLLQQSPLLVQASPTAALLQMKRMPPGMKISREEHLFCVQVPEQHVEPSLHAVPDAVQAVQAPFKQRVPSQQILPL